MTSQSCAECGTRAEPGQSFCDACGAVLSWSDREERAEQDERAARAERAGREERLERMEREVAARSGAEPEPVSVPAGNTPVAAGAREEPRAAAGGAPSAPAPGWDAFSRSGPGGTVVPRTALARLDDPTPETPAQAPDDDTLPQPAVPPGDDAPAPATTATPAPAPAPEPDDTAARARSLLVPVSDPEPRAAPEPSVAPVLPGRPVADRPQVRTPGRVDGVQGGLPCPWCATPNMPDRRFCGRCAMPMSGPDRDEPGRRPWWRRMLDLRGGETPWAGDRPRLRRGFGRVWNWVVGALVLTLLIMAVMYVGDGVDATRDHFAKRAPADPDKVTASRSYPGHKPELAFDKRSNTWWGPGVSESGEGQWIEARFAEPTRLLNVVITPGVSARPETLGESALPKRIEAQVTTADGKKLTRFLTLDQGSGYQTRGFRVGAVTSVRLVIRSAHAATADKQVAIAEIEFFGRSNANAS